MAEPKGYYRFPVIHKDDVIFVSEDDLWHVPRDGGTARRVTAGLGEVTRPRLSPDGQRLYFVGKEEGDREVYVMPILGGPARRLTHLGAGITLAGFHPDGDLVLATNAGQPFASWYELYRLGPDGGKPQPLGLGRAHAVSFGPGGGVVVGRNTQDPARWKRYRGGTRGMLWIDPDGTGTFYRFEGLDGNFADPMWIGDRIYFLCDAEGIANLYSMTPDGKEVQRLTHHQDYYVRHAASDDRSIVYHAGADLFRFDTVTGREHPIPVVYPSQFTQRERIFPSAARFWTEASVHTGTHEHDLLATTRGKLFRFGAFEGPVEAVGITEGVRYRLSSWLPDGSHVLAVSDEGGEEHLELIDMRGHEPPRVLDADLGRITALDIDPKGRRAALSNHRLELHLLNLEDWSLTRVDQSDFGPVLGTSFSPDGRWLAYSLPIAPRQAALKLCAVESGEVHQITDPPLEDVHPSFDPEGRFLYFLSYRIFNPVYDNLRFDLGFPKGMRPYLVVLAKDTPSPFLEPSSLKRARPGVESEDSGSEGGESGEDRPAPADQPVPIDLDGIQNRILPFPVAEGRYLQIAGLSGGRVIYSLRDPEGSLDASFYPGPPKASATLKMYTLGEAKEETLASRMTSFTLSHDGKTLLLRSRQTLRVAKAGEKIDEKKAEPGRESGVVDLGRIPLSVDRGAEWAQMLREAWRLMRENFWTEDMSDVDWNAIYHRYQELLPRVATRSEFSDLVWEMQGELGTSHAYEMGGDYRPEPTHRIGHLAADLSWDRAAQGYRIDHVVEGAQWQEGEGSPLAAPGVGLRPGDHILAVDGQPLGPDLPPASRLIDRGGQPVALTVRRAGQDTPQVIVVRALESETPARYREWVAENRRRVHAASGNRLGYVHVPDMGPRGYAEFFRAYLRESHAEGLIVDVRFNSGGHVSQLILELLGRKRLGYDLPRWGVPIPYPEESVLGPIVALTNEHAGSDGDIFSHAFKMMGLGPLVGTRTWGGVIGISPRVRLVDGSVVTQPEYAFWFQDVGFGVENYGTDPDIWVDITPQDAAQGRDTQLERAIEVGMELMAKTAPRLPDFGPRPSKRPPTLS